MATRVYSFDCDVDHFRTLTYINQSKDIATYPIDIETPRGWRTISRETYELKWGQPMPDTWKHAPLYCPDPNDQMPDFWRVPDLNIAAGPNAFNFVRDHFSRSGQILNLPYREKTLSLDLKLLNVLTVQDCLDYEKCKWREEDKGAFKRLDWQADNCVAFRPERIGDSPIFTIPQARTRYFCTEHDGDPNKEFKAAVEQNNLKGLEFRFRWEG